MGVKESTMILDVIRRLKEKGDVSVIIVAHNYAQIFDFCDRINLLQNGQITFDQRTERYLCRRADQPGCKRVSDCSRREGVILHSFNRSGRAYLRSSDQAALDQPIGYQLFPTQVGSANPRKNGCDQSDCQGWRERQSS